MLAIYVAASWAVLEAADVVVARLSLPEWVYGVAIILLLIGLPIVLATAFVQEGLSPAPRHDPTLMPGAEVAPDAAPHQAKGLRGLFTWRNAITGGALAFGLWGVIATGWLLQAQRTSPRPAVMIDGSAASPGIAVLPFRVVGPELELWREGMVDLLSINSRWCRRAAGHRSPRRPQPLASRDR